MKKKKAFFKALLALCQKYDACIGGDQIVIFNNKGATKTSELEHVRMAMSPGEIRFSFSQTETIKN